MRNGKSDPRKALTRFLRRLVWPETQARQHGLVYRGPADFVLQHGEWFEPRQPPPTYKLGLPGICFGNAIATAVLCGVDYVEGYAVDPGTAALCFHHAWNCADDGLVDVTWAGERPVMLPDGRSVVVRGMTGLAYLGVRFSVERADDCTWNGDASVLDDFGRRWPLLRERWVGESDGLVWPDSPRLRALRLGRDGDRPGALALWETQVGVA